MLTSRLRSRTLHYDDMTLAPQSRGRAAALAAAVLASAAVVVPSVSSAPTGQAAPDDIIAIVVEGTGNGHGRGMSQWGAYGYAVDHGWNWQQILGHYYGGTISGTTAANQRIDVRLTKYDGMGDVGVISHGSGVRWNGQTAPAMRANETSSGVFDIYKANTVACPSSTSLTVPDGPVVEQSAYNADAKRVQRFLRSFHPPAAGIVIDGYFGPQTRGSSPRGRRAGRFRLMAVGGTPTTLHRHGRKLPRRGVRSTGQRSAPTSRVSAVRSDSLPQMEKPPALVAATYSGCAPPEDPSRTTAARSKLSTPLAAIALSTMCSPRTTSVGSSPKRSLPAGPTQATGRVITP